MKREDLTPQYFNLTNAEGIESISAWVNNPSYIFACGNDTVGPFYPISQCLNRIEGKLISSQFGNVTFTIDGDQLPWAPYGPDPEKYVFGIPINRFAMPNVMYEAAEIAFGQVGVDQPDVTQLGGNIFNMFNASASSLREYYGVPSDLQGSCKTIQATTMYFGESDEAVNTTAVSEYLELQGLVPNNPLQFSDWAPPNNVSVCLQTEGNCDEEMLDVQTLQAFVPRAITRFASTQDMPASWMLDLLSSDIRAAIEAAFPTASTMSIEDLFSSDKFQQIFNGLDSQEQNELENAATKAPKIYFKECVSNVSTSEERVSVVSLSWSSPYYYNPMGKNMTMAEKSQALGYLEELLRDLTMSGISILVASGDAGASSKNVDPCLSASNPLVSNQPDVWPIISPWVTVVGGTQFLATQDNPQEEVVCSTATGARITSAGGFSGTFFPNDVYSMPAWQEKAVERYLAENNASTFDGFPTDGTPGYNPKGRAYPDIAMYGFDFPVFEALSGNLHAFEGTSLSAPMAASMFSLANQKLLEDGYEVIGYANPMLYWMGENCSEAFNDITVGDNQANEIPETCLYGYPASPGWDASTGLGSINFEPFVNCAKKYQDEVRSKGLEILPNGTYWGRSTVSTDVVLPGTTSGAMMMLGTLAVVASLAMTSWL